MCIRDRCIAAPVEMNCAFVMKYELTFSDRKPNILMNMSVGKKVGASHWDVLEKALQELAKKKT